MTRYRLDLAYDGTHFAGWAKQPDLRTVQGVFEEALTRILQLPETPTVTCAGRTDAGVHARGQVAHVDLDGEIDVQSLTRGLRGVLPKDATVHAVALAPEGFDARFSALSRHYRYRICDDPSSWDPLLRHKVVRYSRTLSLDAMNAAALPLVGEHDFVALCKQRDRATTIRTVLELQWRRGEDGFAEMRVSADAFCHSLVRALVGALVPVGDGRQPTDWPAAVVASRQRDARVTVMPSHGLVLEGVCYPPADGMAHRQAVTRARRDA